MTSNTDYIRVSLVNKRVIVYIRSSNEWFILSYQGKHQAKNGGLLGEALQRRFSYGILVCF